MFSIAPQLFNLDIHLCHNYNIYMSPSHWNQYFKFPRFHFKVGKFKLRKGKQEDLK